MSDYVLMYQGGDLNWKEKRSPEEVRSMMERWGAWFKELETVRG